MGQQAAAGNLRKKGERPPHVSNLPTPLDLFCSGARGTCIPPASGINYLLYFPAYLRLRSKYITAASPARETTIKEVYNAILVSSPV